MLWRQYIGTTGQKPDIHMKLMSKYKEVPASWYMSIFITVSLLWYQQCFRKAAKGPLGIDGLFGFYYHNSLSNEFGMVDILLALAISIGFSLPIGIIQAMTNTQLVLGF